MPKKYCLQDYLRVPWSGCRCCRVPLRNKNKNTIIFILTSSMYHVYIRSIDMYRIFNSITPKRPKKNYNIQDMA